MVRPRSTSKSAPLILKVSVNVRTSTASLSNVTLDNSIYQASSEEDDDSDATIEEDWAAIGAAGLCARGKGNPTPAVLLASTSEQEESNLQEHILDIQGADFADFAEFGEFGDFDIQDAGFGIQNDDVQSPKSEPSIFTKKTPKAKGISR